MTHTLLTALAFGPDDPQADHLLEEAAALLAARGLRVRGALQRRGGDDVDGRPGPGTVLVVIGSGPAFRIMQSLGAGAGSCRLDADALARCAVYLESELDGECDVLILNRFGKAESEGGGLRDVIAKAIEREIPVLTGLHSDYAAAWVDFAGEDFATVLPASREALHAWAAQLPAPPCPA